MRKSFDLPDRMDSNWNYWQIICQTTINVTILLLRVNKSDILHFLTFYDILHACTISEDKWFVMFALTCPAQTQPISFWNIQICIVWTPLKCSYTLQTISYYRRARCSVTAVKRFSKNVNFNTFHLLQNQSNMSWLHVQEEVMEKYRRIFGCKPVQIYKSKEYVSHIWTVLIQHI